MPDIDPSVDVLFLQKDDFFKNTFYFNQLAMTNVVIPLCVITRLMTVSSRISRTPTIKTRLDDTKLLKSTLSQKTTIYVEEFAIKFKWNQARRQTKKVFALFTCYSMKINYLQMIRNFHAVYVKEHLLMNLYSIIIS